MCKSFGCRVTAFLFMMFFVSSLSFGQEKSSSVVGEITETASGNLTMTFKDADLLTVLELLARKGGVNIIAGKEVSGSVTVKLVDVPWEKALKAILKINNLGYEREGNIITVMSQEKLASRSKSESEISEVQPVITEIFYLKNLDANDAKSAIAPQLSGRGKISVVAIKGQRGWVFGAETTMEKRTRVQKAETEGKAKILIVSDIPPVIERVREIIKTIDIAPRQVMIEAKILEVNHDKLKDFGLDWGSGSTGAENSTLSFVDIERDVSRTPPKVHSQLAGKQLGAQKAPSVFEPKADLSGNLPFDAGLTLAYKRLTGFQFEAILHALSEDVSANLLSAPRIMTLDNQEATILVGTKFPILSTNVSGETTTTVTSTLDYFQEVGIQLNVVPQIISENQINMIVHPAVTSIIDYEEAQSSEGNVLARYPVITTREAETQVIIKSGETIAIGGLLKDIKKESKVGVPLLKDIPLFGLLFQRTTTDVEKIDLLIFLRAFIVEPPQLTETEQERVTSIDSADKIISEEKIYKENKQGVLGRWKKLFKEQ
ncbi:MAG: secretin and TonB N-terminal domain-containing protein [Candidatus Omnitrophica bacterium]|nr:secretin and TonB N-terminal domain-containing protein [Candidatus Omnitrophota bacterium]